MKIAISNYGIKSNEPGPFLTGNIEIVDDSHFEYETKSHIGQKTCLNLILLNPISAAEIARLAKNDHQLQVKICTNIIPLDKIPKTSIAKIASLTGMEIIVLSYLAAGNTKAQIAAIINTSEDTIKSHVNNIYNKTGLHSNVLASLALLLFRAENPDWVRCRALSVER